MLSLRSILLAAGLFAWVPLAAGQRGSVRNRTQPEAEQILGVTPTVGQEIRRSTRFTPGTHLLKVRSGSALQVRGLKDAVLDFSGVVLLGDEGSTAQDELTGQALRLVDCENVTVLGGTFQGFHTPVSIEDCRGVVIEGATFKGNFAQRLQSTLAFPNEKDLLELPSTRMPEWQPAYGAALKLEDCSEVIVRDCSVRGSQNGLLVSDCSGGSIHNNDFSFLSGWGIGLLRTAGAEVSNNRVDYCLRGYSNDYYDVGHHSAGLLLIASLGSNVLAKNSTVGSGTGLVILGSLGEVPSQLVYEASAELAEDEDLIWNNRVSGAVYGGILMERASDLWLVANSVEDCGYAGLRGTDVQRCIVSDNTVSGTPGPGLALEDAREILLLRNVSHENEVGLAIWSSDDSRSKRVDSGNLSEHKFSRDIWISTNSLASNDSDFALRHCDGLRFGNNVYDEEDRELIDSGLSAAEGVPALLLEGRDPETGEDLNNKVSLRDWLLGVGSWMPSGHLTEVTLWHPDAADHPREAEALVFSGVKLASESKGDSDSRKPYLAEFARDANRKVLGMWGPWDFEHASEPTALRQPGALLLGTEWDTRWFLWDESGDPRGGANSFGKWLALADQPILEGKVASFSTPWGVSEARAAQIGREHFGVVAKGRLSLPAGSYRLMTFSDDGLRVSIDGKVVLENWSWHPAAQDTVEFELAEGVHQLELHYFQIDGPAILMLDLESTSAGLEESAVESD